MRRKMQLVRVKPGQGGRGSRTISLKKIRREIKKSGPDEGLLDMEHVVGVMRPHHRMDCASVPRPCPFVSCRYNLYLDINDRGSIVFNYPNLDPGEMKESCALDIAEAGDRSGEEVGFFLNISRERIRQISEEAKKKLVVNELFQRIARENGVRKEWIEYFACRHQKGDKSKG